MSKILKNNEIQVDSNRTPTLRSKRSNNMLNPTPSSSKLMIGKQESPYGKIHSIAKTRSSSNLKSKSQIKLKNVSPARVVNVSSGVYSSDPKIRLEKSSSNQNSISNSFTELKENSHDSANFHKEALEIEIKYNQKMREALTNRDSLLRTEKMIDLHKEIFKEIITIDKPFSSLLKKIFGFFDRVTSEQFSDIFKADLKQKIQELNVSIKGYNEIIKNHEKKNEKLVKENEDLNIKIERNEEICTEIQKKLCKITNFSSEEVPKDEKNWKALLLENRNFMDALELLKEENKELKYRQKKMVNLFVILKEKGIPIEEIYKKEMKVKKEKKLPNYSQKSVMSSNSETENIVSGRARSPEKPTIVPNLQLSEIEPESFSSDSEDYDTSSKYTD